MKTTFNNFINESGTPMGVDRVQLTQKIRSLENWLYQYEGLDLMNIIDDLLSPYKTKISQEEISRFNMELDILRKTDYPNIDRKLHQKFPYGISNATLVKINGKWSYVNKLNTSYYDLTELLVYLIVDVMMKDKSKRVREEYGIPIYETIINDDIKKGLLILRPKLKSIIKYYLIEKGRGLDDFLFFTENIKYFSQLSEKGENKIKDYLLKNDFIVDYQGGDGDFIDMIFGCDLIVHRDDFGYKTIQVKLKMPIKEKVKYYNVNWIAVPQNDIIILDKNTFQSIKFD